MHHLQNSKCHVIILYLKFVIKLRTVEKLRRMKSQNQNFNRSLLLALHPVPPRSFTRGSIFPTRYTKTLQNPWQFQDRKPNPVTAIRGKVSERLGVYQPEFISLVRSAPCSGVVWGLKNMKPHPACSNTVFVSVWWLGLHVAEQLQALYQTSWWDLLACRICKSRYGLATLFRF